MLWDSKSNLLSSLEVDENLEFGGQLYRQIGRFGPLQDLDDILGSAPVQICRVRSVGD